MLTRESVIPMVLTGDGAKLHQILHNLLTNAIQYTESGMLLETAMYIDVGARTCVIARAGCRGGMNADCFM